MKLLFCPTCADMRKLHYGDSTYCQCRESWGKYLDESLAEFGGKAVPFGIVNGDIYEAMNADPNDFRTVRAFRFARAHKHIKRSRQ